MVDKFVIDRGTLLYKFEIFEIFLNEENQLRCRDEFKQEWRSNNYDRWVRFITFVNFGP